MKKKVTVRTPSRECVGNFINTTSQLIMYSASVQQCRSVFSPYHCYFFSPAAETFPPFFPCRLQFSNFNNVYSSCGGEKRFLARTRKKSKKKKKNFACHQKPVMKNILTSINSIVFLVTYKYFRLIIILFIKIKKQVYGFFCILLLLCFFVKIYEMLHRNNYISLKII